MDLIIWRHAEAEDLHEGIDDLQRELTPRGMKEAVRMARWLDASLPEGARILCSPALRCDQTAHALGRRYRICPELAPGAQTQTLLELAKWPAGRQSVLLVGHQPDLGQLVAHVLGIEDAAVSVRKGGVWWLRHRVRDAQASVVVHAVLNPDLV